MGKTMNDAEKQRAKDLYVTLRSTVKVGHAMGRSPATIYGYLASQGLVATTVSAARRRRPPTPKPKAVSPAAAKPKLATPDEAPSACGPMNDFPEGRRTCRWIAGDPNKVGWQTCGAPGFPWCEFHAGQMHQRKVVAA